MQLERSAGRPFDEIRILGLEATAAERPSGELTAHYRPTGSASTIPIPVQWSEDGAAALLVPPHPNGIVGGEGIVRLGDSGELDCPEMALAVEAIPEAPGEIRRYAAGIETLVRRRIELLGFDPDAALEGPIEELPLILVPQAAAYRALRGGEGPESLRGLLDRHEGEMGFADALLHQAGLRGELEAELAALEELEPLPPRASTTAARLSDPRPAAGVRRGVRWGGTLAMTGQLALVQGPGGPPSNRPNIMMPVLNSAPVTITTAAELSHYMTLQVKAERRVSGRGDRMFRDALKLSNLLISIAGPGVGKVLCLIRWSEGTSSQGLADLLPCCFESFEFDLERERFEEDYPFPPSFPKWSNARVRVRNRGGNLTGTGATLAGCMVPGGGLVAGLVPDLDGLRLPAYSWSSITLAPGSEWCRAEASGAIRTVSTQGYAPIDVGTGKLTVETLRGKFGHAHKALAKVIPVEEILVSVTPKIQRVRPGEQVELRAFVRNSLQPQEVKWKVWTAKGAQLRSFTSEYLGDGVHAIVVTTPTVESAFPIEVEAESTSRDGLRSNGTPRRYGSATLTTGIAVTVGPEPACVARGEELQMWAEVVGSDDTRVDWRVVDGPARIDRRSGVLSPTGEGAVTVRGTSAAEPEAWDEASVEAGRCSCMFSAVLSGDTMKGNASGGVAHFSTEGGATLQGAFSNPEMIDAMTEMFGGMMGEEEMQRAEEWKREMAAMPRETLGVSLIEMDPAEEGDETFLAAFGGFKLQASVMDEPIEPGFAGGLPLAHVSLHTGEYTEGGYPTQYEWAPGAPGNATLTVSHYSGGSLSGTISGTLVAPGLYKEATGEPPRISFTASFYALEFDPLNMDMGCFTP